MARKAVAKAGGKQKAKEKDADARTDPSERKRTIVFFHPDLGIGGAERLVVDAAVGLQERGHKVVIFTNHCDPNHCFDECKPDGILDVRVRASGPVPMSIFNRFTILCAIARHIQLLLQINYTRELTNLNPDALIVDQLSAGLPLLQYFVTSGPILFYCHFPDLLLAQGREKTIKRLYRVPFDWLEEFTMGFAQAIAVNSRFTKGVVANTWPALAKSSPMKVVYPCVETGATEEPSTEAEKLFGGDKIILSINRFERKKDIALAIKAFAAIPDKKRQKVRLVIAGGYDHRIDENVKYHTELQALADSLSISHQTIKASEALSTASPDSRVLFLPSVPGATKDKLLRAARLLVYTPSQEHFGIVPLEAMLARTPVLAATTGGPVETVVDNETGWLRDTADIPAWTEVMIRALDMPDKKINILGDLGAKRVRDNFSRDAMARNLEDIVSEMRSVPPNRSFLLPLALNLFIVAIAFVIGIVASQSYYTVKDFISASSK
ncbi:unnamed protein product [Clonostachys byssicola]|uniref:Alpha-1,3/1,6-mannosyltransferase ALG2 n=1 Tax=Clonostachys byssicola TaxID=160290 RepID=A0A9N9Y7J8_9HYPO|nr:unnamed protein product [Clonostachys byssicola]